MAAKKANSTTKLNNRIAALRKERDITRTGLAMAVGVHYRSLAYMERGRFNPSLEVAFRISEYFGVPIEAIFTRAEEHFKLHHPTPKTVIDSSASSEISHLAVAVPVTTFLLT